MPLGGEITMDASLTSKQLRQMFIDYFVKEDHVHWRSSSTIPHEDPTLLFANAGMNQVRLSSWEGEGWGIDVGD